MIKFCTKNNTMKNDENLNTCSLVVQSFYRKKDNTIFKSSIKEEMLYVMNHLFILLYRYLSIELIFCNKKM
jgi:hypothetical protein